MMATRMLALRPAALLLLVRLLMQQAGVALADGVDWTSMIEGSPIAGTVLYGGDGTFYGQQDGQNDWGTCSYGAAVSDTLDLDWNTGIQTHVALNAAQFNSSYSCGLCLWYRGTGQGIGTTPITKQWTFALVDNLCPECASGAIDLNKNGDGRWHIEWFPAPCNVGNGTFKYTMSGDIGNPFWFQFNVANTRVPVAMVEMSSWGKWYPMRRGFNNMFAANGGPFTFPISIRLTSVLGDTVYDEIPEKAGGWGTVQFPDRGSATFPLPSAGNSTAAVPAPAHGSPGAPAPLPAASSSSSNASSNSSVATAPVSSTNAGAQAGGSAAQAQATATVTAFSSSPPTGAAPSASPPPPSPIPKAASQPSQPLSSISSTFAGDGKFPVVANSQCGGKGSYCGSLIGNQCQDKQWDSAECPSGYVCQRWTEWWWQCSASGPGIDEYNGPPQAASVPAPGGSAAYHWKPQDGSFSVQGGNQCGGSGGVCSMLGTDQCKDSKWDGAVCPNAITCTRNSPELWTCGPPVQSFGRKLI